MQFLDYFLKNMLWFSSSKFVVFTAVEHLNMLVFSFWLHFESHNLFI